MQVTIIIPTLNEQARISNCIASAKKLRPFEIIVVDAGSTDDTVTLAKKHDAVVIQSQKGRGVQIKRAAAEAQGDILLFVHADATLPEDITGEDLAEVIKGGFVGGFFRLRFDSDSLSIRLVEAFANLRSRLFSLPYGDQGIFLSKRVYKEIGGFRDFPFLEDLDLVLRLRKKGKLKRIDKPVTVSSRRLLKGYPLAAIIVSLRNVVIALLFMFGVKPEKLVRLYK